MDNVPDLEDFDIENYEDHEVTFGENSNLLEESEEESTRSDVSV